MKKLAIIPARGGSKRIERKNIKPFLGKPIISFSIETAISSKLFDEIMVSTDDSEIAEISEKLGATIPFFRSKETSTDFATTSEVLTEVLNKYAEMGKKFDYCCCIYPTAPFISVSKLNESLELLQKNSFDSVFPVVKFGYPIFRALQKNDGKINMIWEENLNKRSQDLPAAFHDAGQFYWFDVEKFLTKKAMFTDNSGAIELSELEVQDIDNEVDWKLAELKYQLIYNV